MLVKGATGRHQAIIWTNARVLLIGRLGTNTNFIQENAFENVAGHFVPASMW